MKFLKTWLAIVGLLAAFIMVAPAPAQAAPYCGITWASLVKSPGLGSIAPITNVRAGRRDCFDHMVVDINGRTGGYNVHYVSAVHSPGKGAIVQLHGGAFIEVVVPAPAYDAAYTGGATYRQLAMAGSYEGSTTLGLGVRARLPLRVFILAGPGTTTRLVVDVAHRW